MGFEAFLDEILQKEDVWLVTSWQALQWVRQPTPLNRIRQFPPFQCNYPVIFENSVLNSRYHKRL